MMKRKFGFLLFAALLSTAFVGCTKSNDDKKPEPTNYADKLAGTFKGDAVFGSEAAVTTKATIKATGENVVEITVLDYKFSATVTSDLVIGGVKVELADEKNLSLSGNAQATVGGQSVAVALTGSALVSGENVKFDISAAGQNGLKYSGSRYTNATGAELMSPVVSGVCVISSEYDAAKGIITYKVPSYARQADLEAIEATFTISDGASWVMTKEEDTKASEAQKLNLKKAMTTIEVTAENGEKKSYTFQREAVNVEDVSVSVINTYSGDLLVSLGGAPATTVKNQKITVARSAANMVKFTITDFTFTGIKIGDIVVDNVALYKGTNEIAISGDGKVKINLGTGDTEVDVKISGNYSLTDKKINLTIVIAVDPNLTVTCTYEAGAFVNPVGTKPLFVSASHANIIQQEFDEDGNFTYYVDAKYPDADYANLKVEIKLPEGATYKVTSTPEFDFTESTEWYTVTAADGTTTENYSITREGLEFANQKEFSFSEEWVDANGVGAFDPKGWQTPNFAVYMIKAMSDGKLYPMEAPYPVNPIDAGKVGKGVKMETLDTKGGVIMETIQVPKVTAGTLYTGVFNFVAAMGNALEATEFGLFYNGPKPTKLKGWYTYAPGAKYLDYDGTTWTETSTVDQASVSVVLYDVTDNVAATITGVDTYDSPRIVAMGKINPAKAASFTEFSVDLVYKKAYTPATRIYKLAYIMSASKDGDKYKGAPGSTFVVDELTLVTE